MFATSEGKAAMADALPAWRTAIDALKHAKRVDIQAQDLPGPDALTEGFVMKQWDSGIEGLYEMVEGLAR